MRHVKMTKRASGTRRRLLAGLCAGASLCAAAPVAAEVRSVAPLTGMEEIATPLPDADLAAMRGKFINPNGIAYFGVQLHTSWQGADGITTQATVVFNVDLAGASTVPRLMIGWTRDCDKCADSSVDVAGFGPAAAGSYVAVVDGASGMPIGGLASVQGAVQSQTIAGTDNNVRNAMTIAVVPIGDVNRPDTSGLTVVTASTAQAFADGDEIRFILAPGEIGLAMTSGGTTDSVRQGLNGAINQFAQNVLLESSFNTINNVASINVGIDELAAGDRIQMAGALSAMKGRGF